MGSVIYAQFPSTTKDHLKIYGNLFETNNKGEFFSTLKDQVNSGFNRQTYVEKRDPNGKRLWLKYFNSSRNLKQTPLKYSIGLDLHA